MPETPTEFMGNMMLLAMLPHNIAMLQGISECLDRGDWDQAVEMGMLGALTNIGTHFDQPSLQDTTTPHGPEHPKIRAAKEAYHGTMNDYEMAEGILRSEGIEMETERVTKPEEKKAAIGALSINVNELIRVFSDIHTTTKKEGASSANTAKTI